MTYSTMLVDDESIDLEWLFRRVSEHKDKLSVDAAVNSGFAALQLLRERPFDIMISDIRMPILSGLELAAKARELRPELQIVFISGHEDFEYAKQAIKVNASAYLLKPVDDDELKDTVRQLVAKLDAERQSRDTGKRLQEALPHIEKELLLGWLEGTVSPELEPVAAKMLEPLAREEGLELAVLEIDDLEWKLSDMGEEERRSLLHRIHQTIRVLCEEEGGFSACRTSSTGWCWSLPVGEAGWRGLPNGCLPPSGSNTIPLRPP
ncbi:response regulator [Paenibacillus sp. CC-CFT747]|nr:response regulator [Paenibacillus sp. CC-CFT747]